MPKTSTGGSARRKLRTKRELPNFSAPYTSKTEPDQELLLSSSVDPSAPKQRAGTGRPPHARDLGNSERPMWAVPEASEDVPEAHLPDVNAIKARCANLRDNRKKSGLASFSGRAEGPILERLCKAGKASGGTKLGAGTAKPRQPGLRGRAAKPKCAAPEASRRVPGQASPQTNAKAAE